jgi:gliding motility-associated-like protein
LPVISVINDTICRGEIGSLQASGGITYNWQPGNMNGPVISVSPQYTTSYAVLASDTAGCSNTSGGIVFVNALPVVTTTSDSICTGEFGTVTASGASTFLWMQSGNTGSSYTANPLATTSYSVIGTSPAGCTGLAMATIVVSPKPVVSFDVGPSGCAPVEVWFQNLTQGLGLQSIWEFGDGTISTDFSPGSHIYQKPGIYSVKLTISHNGCMASVTNPRTIYAYPSPEAGFTIDDIVQEISQTQVQLHNTSSGETYRFWEFGDGFDDNTGVNDPVHLYKDTGMFTICLSVKNNYGCIDSICNDIEVKPTWAFFIANAFTPNEDDKNEGFIGKSYNVIEHEMWIYDRWGLMIYETGKTPNPESAKAWDGKVKGGSTPVQQDVYVWKVKIKDINHKYHHLIGHVTVVK